MGLSFLAPQFLWALLGVPLVIALHFVRTRRRRQPVSAAFLWRKAQHMAQARRRFASSWLLALQIAAVVAASLALAQPTLRTAAAPDRVLVIDASASMAARRSDGTALLGGFTSQTRLEQARREAAELLAGAGRVALVRAGLDATVAHPLDDDRATLRRSLEALRAGDREASLGRALALASSVAPEGEIHLFSDAPPPADAPARLVHHPVGQPTGGGDAAPLDPPGNLGIATFDVGLQQAFVSVVSNLARPLEVDVELWRDGARVAGSTLLVPVGRAANVSFPLSGGGIFEARLALPEGDALALDDVAFAGRGALRVLLERRSAPLERALAAIPDVEARLAAPSELPGAAPDDAAADGGAGRGADGAAVDAYVLFGADPATLPAGRFLLFAEPSAEPSFKAVRDWDQASPLLRFVDLRDTVVGVDPAWSPPAGANEPGSGWRTLASSADLTPLLLVHTDPEREVVVAAFHPSQTDLVFRPAFPTLMANVVAAFRGREALPLGAPLPAAAGAAGGGEAVERILQPGVYEVEGQLRPASLLSASESRLTLPPPALAPPAPEEPERTVRRRGAASWLLLAMLLLLLAEWWLYSGARAGGALRRLRRG